jgi:hypothetical protein
MKVRNLTDGPGELLKAYGMENHTIAVGDVGLEPGKMVEVPGEQEAHTRALLAHFIAVGAIGIDAEEPPPVDASVEAVKTAEPSPRSRPTTRPIRRTEG